MDIFQICRSCMKELSLWENENVDNRTLEMFYFCINIKVSDDDKLPKQFCNNCIIKIESSYTYITEAQKADATLRNIVSRTKTSVIVEPENYNRNFFEEQYIHTIKETHDINPNFNEQVLYNVQSEIDQNYSISEFETCKNLEETDLTNSQNDEVVGLELSKNSIHNASNKVEAIKNNVCPVCKKGFTSKTWFTKHMQKEHSGQKFTCSHCPKTFAKSSQLTYHLTSHSDERRFPCGTCGKRFKRNKQLAVHVRAHADAKPYACDKCTMRFKKRSILKCHMKVHENDKQFLCSFCGWSFAQAGNLAVHVRRHTGEKPFACGACGFRAAAASNLRRHERAHRRAAASRCALCGKGFYDASALTRHMRTHSGERPFRCPWCARAFADSWKRKLHLMRAHKLALQDVPRLTRDGQLLE